MLGTTLGGRYKILSPLGAGGFGETYLAEDSQLPDNCQCVVKHLKPQSSNPEVLQVARRLFDSEAKVLHKLGKHEQIPQLLAHFEENGEFYLVQEFIAGTNLSQELPPSKPWTEAEAITLLKDILQTLAFVHQQQVIHRDIKPENLIRRRLDGKIVLIDFGAVKQICTQVITQKGRMASTVTIGTLDYMPSEQANGHPQLSSDLYALGIIGIEALTGLAPHEIPKDPQTLELDWEQHAEVSSGLAQVLNKMVRFDFRQRYQSADETLQALANVTTNIPTVAVLGLQNLPATVIAKQAVPLPVKTLVGAGIGIGVAVIATMFLLNQPPKPSPITNLNSSPSSTPIKSSAAPSSKPLNATDFYNQAQALSTAGKSEEVIAAYEQAIKLNPNYAEAWYDKARELAKLRRYKEAIAAYDRVIQIKPDYKAALSERTAAVEALQKLNAPSIVTEPSPSPNSISSPSTSTANESPPPVVRDTPPILDAPLPPPVLEQATPIRREREESREDREESRENRKPSKGSKK